MPCYTPTSLWVQHHQEIGAEIMLRLQEALAEMEELNALLAGEEAEVA